ncbi:hypothetical protein ICN43_03030 [Polynucleobacter sp. UK-Mo-2m-Kol15]|nr:hypothetical protein [Polynucleobacter sp. UK-Mo-2m-Kol15]
MLIFFVLISIFASQLCNPEPNNPVVTTVSNALSASKPMQNNATPDPLSWEPLLQQLLSFFSKACPR